jgi:hypothetical protein
MGVLAVAITAWATHVKGEHYKEGDTFVLLPMFKVVIPFWEQALPTNNDL